MRQLASVIPCFLAILGCTTTHRFPLGDLTLIANRNVPSQVYEVVERDIGEQVCDEVGATVSQATLGAAITELQRRVPESDAIANADLTLILINEGGATRWCVHVRGDAVRFR